MRVMSEAISEAIYPYLQCPFLLFGHSLGARIAFEVARNLRRTRGIQPCRLIVAGSRAPHIPEPRPLHQLPEEEFINELRRFSGTPEAILQSKELLQFFLPILRADFQLDETYVYVDDAPLDCPISVFGGTDDTEASREELDAWAAYTTGECSVEMIKGDHFFLKTQRDELLRSISQIMDQLLNIS
ncbi:hypothetical protein XYCOK13_31020 [Xylanibacillus composti]|uniref:Thioesterase domain-containing protein n=2 Tax=Xylanibacillus composti TaxID=1572762 RepID=A0A8J4H811_9BACL|nr:hypothetical protein XYCOK13_31020 [Xylanibacillus composti]